VAYDDRGSGFFHLSLLPCCSVILISLPEVYLKVRQLMDDPASDIYDFAEVISVDPNLSTRVLKVVNSAYFDFPEPVVNIARAVKLRERLI
jgi:HD-like signal output (HDOD) protein